jgi:hypothetical protein
MAAAHTAASEMALIEPHKQRHRADLPTMRPTSLCMYHQRGRVQRVRCRPIHPRDTFVLLVAAHGTSKNGRFNFILQEYQGGPGDAAPR